MTKKSSPPPALRGKETNPAVRSDEALRASFAGSAGYRFDGESVELNAELSLSSALPRGLYTLELAASQGGSAEVGSDIDRPVASAVLDLPTPLGPITHRVHVVAAARIPPAGESYSMTLRLVYEEKSGLRQTLDQLRFARHETFPAPCFVGSVSYQLDDGDILFEVDRIESARPSDNLSGTLSLELRSAPSRAELEQEGGFALAAFRLAPLSGGYFVGPMLCRTKLQRRIEPGQRLYLVLREFTGDGYATRDFREVARPKDAPVVHKVSVGHAGLEELVQLEGISLKIAKEIIKARPFASLGDLVRVKGLGQKTLEKLRGRLTL